MTRFLLFFLLLATQFNAFGQNYRPMLSNSSEWYYHEIGFWIATFKYTKVSDSTYAGKTYATISRTLMDIPSPHTTGNFYLIEDSLAKTVHYIFDINNQNDTLLLYDFNLLPGDTFHIPRTFSYQILDSITYNFNDITNSFSTGCTITTLDSSRNDIVPLKIFHFLGGMKWVEGIGSLSSLLHDNLIFDCGNFLNCHFNDYGIKDFHLSDYSSQMDGECFSYFVGLEENNQKHQKIIVSPNPSSSNTISVAGENIHTIEIFSIQGKSVLTTTQSVIDTGNLPKGVYLVKASFESGEIATEKLVLQ